MASGLWKTGRMHGEEAVRAAEGFQPGASMFRAYGYPAMTEAFDAARGFGRLGFREAWEAARDIGEIPAMGRLYGRMREDVRNRYARMGISQSGQMGKAAYGRLGRQQAEDIGRMEIEANARKSAALSNLYGIRTSADEARQRALQSLGQTFYGMGASEIDRIIQARQGLANIYMEGQAGRDRREGGGSGWGDVIAGVGAITSPFFGEIGTQAGSKVAGRLFR